MAYITTTELRYWVGLVTTDNPNDTILDFIIEQCEIKLSLEAGITTTSYLKLLSLMICSSKVLRWLANNSVKNGYVSFSHEGITKQKSTRELIEVANQMNTQYYEMLNNVQNCDVVITTPLSDSDIPTNTQQDIRDMWQGVGGVWDFALKYAPSFKPRND